MVRQYIGARYVTKIYENSLDPSSAEWEAGVTYEPLTMVTYLNSSYLSKKAVPGSVGDPAANPSYWVVTGAYNGQIAQLQNDVQELQQASAKHEIAQKDRKYILIFDSFGALGVSAIAEQACTGGYHTINVGGAGFTAAGGGYTFGDKLDEYLQSLTADECAEFTDVMVFGGVNDYNESAADLLSSMTAFNGICQTYIPQCRITLCPDAYPIRDAGTFNSYLNRVLASYSFNCSQLGWRYMNGLNAFIHNDNYIQADGIHPNATGVNRLGYAIKDLILNDRMPELTDTAKNVTITPATGLSSSSEITTMIDGHNLIVNAYITITSSSPTEVVGGANNAVHLVTLADSDLYGAINLGKSCINIDTCAYISDTDAGTWVTRNITIQIYAGKVYMSIQGPTLHFNALQTCVISATIPLNVA